MIFGELREKEKIKEKKCSHPYVYVKKGKPPKNTFLCFLHRAL
jgi:hypothetical protein